MRRNWRRLLYGWGPQEIGVACAVLVLGIVITLVNPEFLTLENAFDLFSNYAFMGILSAGLLVVLVSGGIDISFVAVATVAQYVVAVVIVQYGGNIGIAFLVAAAVGTALGLTNAVVIHFLRIPSIVATIATMNIFHGLLIEFSGGRGIYNLPAWFRDFGAWNVVQFTRGDGTTYGLSVKAVVLFAVFVATAMLLKYTMLGRKVYALGGNPVAARRAGFNVLGIQIFVYGYMGLLAGIAGMVHTLDVPSVAPNALVGRELIVFAAVVLGGASLTGGVGTTRGTVLGVALVAILSNGLTLARVPPVWNKVAIGAVILISVTVGAIRFRRALARRAAR